MISASFAAYGFCPRSAFRLRDPPVSGGKFLHAADKVEFHPALAGHFRNRCSLSETERFRDDPGGVCLTSVRGITEDLPRRLIKGTGKEPLCDPGFCMLSYAGRQSRSFLQLNPPNFLFCCFRIFHRDSQPFRLFLQYQYY